MIKYTIEYLMDNANENLVTLGKVAEKLHCKMAVHGKHAIGLTWKQLRCAHFKKYFNLKSHFAAMWVFEDYKSNTIEGQTYEVGKLYVADTTGMLTEVVEPAEALKVMVERIKNIKTFDKAIVKMREAVEVA